LQQRLVDDRNVRVVIVGGGGGGVELALAVHHALVLVAPSARMVLVTASAQLLDGHAAVVRRRFTALLKARGIDVLTQFAVMDADASGVTAATDAAYLGTCCG
jgi:selenide,water dikinase